MKRRRWMPAPWLSFCLLVMWLLLNQSIEPGQWLLGAFLAWGLPYFSQNLIPYSVVVRRPWAIVRLTVRVGIDILMSNIAVARIIPGKRELHRFSGFMEIPLDMRHPYGLAALACIVTGCPGTVWGGLTEDGRILTLHVLDLQDESEWVSIIKDRYESLLIEIFEYPEAAKPQPEDMPT